jgi:hypothetical protein
VGITSRIAELQDLKEMRRLPTSTQLPRCRLLRVDLIILFSKSCTAHGSKRVACDKWSEISGPLWMKMTPNLGFRL